MRRLAVDIGGTFTDAVFFDDEEGEVKFFKAPSTPEDYSTGLVSAIGPFRSAVAGLEHFVHGTTVCTNAIIQNKLSPIAFVTTEGFRDVLEIQRCNRTEIYDPMYRKPTPVVPRHLRFEVPERTLADGSIERPLDEAAVLALARRIGASAVDAVAICLLNSYANDLHERRVAALLQQCCPSLYIVTSTSLSREFREYERSCTVAFNAALAPVMRRYLSSLEGRMRELGFGRDIHIMQANGGVMTARTACERPINTVHSGLVGGVVATRALAELLDEQHVIGTDMGGTSFDVSIVVGKEYATLPQMSIRTPASGHGSYPIQIPALDTHAIGAGGGSIAWIDEGGLLHVGPISAGAEPGPACYGRGGQAPTVTDANLTLGRLDADRFLGGRMAVHPELARAAIEPVARRFGKSVEAAAEGIITIAVSNMANAIRTMTVRRGVDPRDFVMISAGGAGPLHAALIARELGIRRVIVPTFAGNFAAWGILCTAPKHNASQTFIAVLQDAPLAQINATFEQMEAEMRSILASEGVAADRIELTRTLAVRYLGQGHAIEVPVPSRRLEDEDRIPVAAAFDEQHLQRYLHNAPEEPKEIVAVKLTAVGRIPTPRLARAALGERSPAPSARRADREVFIDGEKRLAAIFDRDQLRPGNELRGPAIIEEAVANTLLLPGQIARVDAYGNLVLSFTAEEQ